MSEPFLGQIQPMAFNFAPKGWAQCNGQLMNISQNTALFALLGTTYGGNGVSTFALPNLQSRAPLGFGTFVGDSYFLGETGGQETVTITTSTMPTHSHTFSGGTADGDRATPVAGAALGKIAGTGGNSFYASDATPQPLDPASLGMAGGNQAHDNLQPYLVINWCIATFGIFPSRN
jgi:microcystin-dependent protein